MAKCNCCGVLSLRIAEKYLIASFIMHKDEAVFVAFVFLDTYVYSTMYFSLGEMFSGIVRCAVDSEHY